jgi:hypothetical protein
MRDYRDVNNNRVVTTLYQLFRFYITSIVNDELLRMGKKSVIAYFEILFQ